MGRSKYEAMVRSTMPPDAIEDLNRLQKSRGFPPVFGTGKPVNVTIWSEDIEPLTALGDGSLSNGIRIALYRALTQ